MARERWRVWILGAIGTVSLLYVLASQTAVDGGSPLASRLVWPLLGVLPLFGLGLWLAHVSTNRLALYLLCCSTATAVSTSFEAYIVTNPSVVYARGFALLSALHMTIDVLAGILGGLMIATFPNGQVERPWQRRVLPLVWVGLLLPPLALFASPTVLVSPWLGVVGHANPYAIPSLAWAAPLAAKLSAVGWGTVGLGVIILVSRALTGDPRTRARLRFMAVTVIVATAAYTGWSLAKPLGLEDSPAYAVTVSVLVYATMLALPVAFVHGVLQYGAFGVDPDERVRVVMRSASFLVGIAYAAAVATPAALIGWRTSMTVVIVVTVLMALAMQPLRAFVLERIRRRVAGDRAKQLALLTSLGIQLEHTASLEEVLDQLARTIRDGLSASWVRLRVLDADRGWSATTRGEAGAVGATQPVVGHDLIRSGEVIGRVDLGPRRIGDYTPHELELLATVARQATTAVANVRLTAQLEEQLAELTASRERLVAVQDEERRRIERDLHDGIQQDVVALIAGLRLARNRLARGALEPAELAELQDQTREMLADLREIAHGIHPPVLTDNGLFAAVESRASRFPLPLEVTAEDGLRAERFAPDVETTAYYVVRESLANVAKHADATRARVRLSRKDGQLVIDVEDDGHGFDLASTNGHGGLANIRDRIAAVHGQVVVTSRGGSGTRVTAELPVGPRGEIVREGAQHG